MIECIYKYIRYKKIFYNNVLCMHIQEVYIPISFSNHKISEDISNRSCLSLVKKLTNCCKQKKCIHAHSKYNMSLSVSTHND